MRKPGFIERIFLGVWTLFAVGMACLFTFAYWADWVACSIGGSATRGRNDHYVHFTWARVCMLLLGQRVCVVNQRLLDHNAMWAFNHSSQLDILASIVASEGRLRLVARENLRKLFVLGKAMARMEHIFLKRESPRSARKTYRAMGARIRSGELLAGIFPEGTRSLDGTLGELRPAAMEPAIVAGVPIQPIAIVGSHETLPKGARMIRRFGLIELRVGELIYCPPGLTGSAARAWMREQLRESLLAMGVPDGLAVA